MNGSVRVYLKKEGYERWQVRYRYKGKRHEISRDEHGDYMYTESEAVRVLGLIQSEIKNGNHDPERWKLERISKLAIDNVVGQYLEWKKEHLERGIIKLQHFKDIGGFFQNHFVPICEKVNIEKVNEIRGYDLDTVYKHLPKKWSAKTLKNTIGYLSNFFTYARKKGYIDKIPEFPELAESQDPPVRWMEGEEQLSMIEALPKKHHPLLMFLMLYGVRASEAIGLNTEDVDFKQGIITIRRAWVKGRIYPITKTKKIRFLPIEDGIIPFLKEAMKGRIGEGMPLFLNPTTGNRYSYTALRHIWRKAREKIGSDKSLTEGTRKSVATAALNAGERPKDIARMLGHSEKIMFRHYAQLKAGRLKTVFGESAKVLRLEDGVGKKWGNGNFDELKDVENK